MTPVRIRFFILAFIALATGISVNALYLQDAPSHAVSALKTNPSAKERAAQPPDSLTASLPQQSTVSGAAEKDNRIGAGSLAAPRRNEPRTRQTRTSQPPKRVVRAIQRELNRRGYDAGPVNGEIGLQVRAAVLAYEFDKQMPLTGAPDEAILKSLLFSVGERREPGSAARFERREALIADVQTMLANLGYGAGAVNGRLGPRTREAIRRFQNDRGLGSTGRLTARVLLEMIIVSGQTFNVSG